MPAWSQGVLYILQGPTVYTCSIASHDLKINEAESRNDTEWVTHVVHTPIAIDWQLQINLIVLLM